MHSIQQDPSLSLVIQFLCFSKDIPFNGRYNHGNSGNGDSAFHDLSKSGINSDDSIYILFQFIS